MIPSGQLKQYPKGKQETQVLLDLAALPLKETGVWETKDLIHEFETEVRSEMSNQPIYFFCGFGFTDPRYRTLSGFHATTQDDYVITKAGIREDFMRRLYDNIDNVISSL
jgi:hypothetical protein